MLIIFDFGANVRYVRDAAFLLHLNGLYLISQKIEQFYGGIP